MGASVLPAYEYRLDSHDLVDWVSEDWLGFARENGGTELSADNVVGKSLWNFISDEPTRHLYRGIFNTVRATDEPVVFPFRCDSPTLRRFMRLEIRHIFGYGIGMKSILVAVEPCERRTLLDAAALQSANCITMCSCCKLVLVEPHGWLSIEDASSRARLCESGKRPIIRYDVCGTCRTLAIRQRIAVMQSKLEASRREVTTENVLEWINLAKEKAELTELVEGFPKK